MDRLAANDELGNPVAHFFKSGNVLRNPKSNRLVEIKKLIPETWINGTKVEYDIWYNFDDDRVHGYVYTDLLTKFIYLRVASEKMATAIMVKAAGGRITNQGEKIFKSIAQSTEDKYRLRPTAEQHAFVVFLAGTNILDKGTDWKKVEAAVKQGAKLKCHPITAASAYENLRHRFGRDNVIDKKKSGAALLDRAEIVGCCDNSEMGIVALAKGKNIYRFGKQNQWCTYSAIYRALDDEGTLQQSRLKAILSSQSSGLISTIDAEPADKVAQFFSQYSGCQHVAPKNISYKLQSINRAYAQ